MTLKICQRSAINKNKKNAVRMPNKHNNGIWNLIKNQSSQSALSRMDLKWSSLALSKLALMDLVWDKTSLLPFSMAVYLTLWTGAASLP